MRNAGFHVLPLSEAERGVRGTPVQNALVVHSALQKEFAEVNPDLKMIDSASAFWHSVEAEAKLGTDLPLERFEELLDRLPSDTFSFGPPSSTLSYERHFLLRCNGAEGYIVRLGKKGDKRKPALKFKETRSERGGILVRSMKLEAWSEAAFERVVAEFAERHGGPVDLTALRPFYKNKLRAVCVHRQHGIVFGVSLDHSKVEGGSAELAQVEVEYWSTLLPAEINFGETLLPGEGLIHDVHVELCGLIQQQIQKMRATCETTVLTKSEWIRQVTECV
jgi:hypothetical protein